MVGWIKKLYFFTRISQKNWVTPNTWLPDLTSGTCFRGMNRKYENSFRVFTTIKLCVYFLSRLERYLDLGRLLRNVHDLRDTVEYKQNKLTSLQDSIALAI